MASPGPRQIFLSKIIKLAFPETGGGLVYFTWKYNEGYFDEPSPPPTPRGLLPTAPSGPYGAIFDFSSSTVQIDGGSFDITSGRHDIIRPNLDPVLAKKDIPVRNPITTDMLKKYAAWTPNGNPLNEMISSSTPGIDVWIVDSASWQLVYDHHNTSHLTPPMSQAAAVELYKSLAGTTGYEGVTDVNKVGVIIEQVPHFINGVWDGTFADPPYPPSADGWSFWSGAPGWAGHMQTGNVVQGHGRRGWSYWVINLQQIRKLMPKAKQKDPKFVFFIRMPRKGTGVKYELRAAVVAGSGPALQQKDFPIQTSPASEKNFPKNTNVVQDVRIVGDNPKLNGYAKVTVYFQSKDSKGKLVPPRIEFDNQFGSGGGAQ